MNTTTPSEILVPLTPEQKATIAASGERFRRKLRESGDGQIHNGANDPQRSLRKKLLSSPKAVEEFVKSAVSAVRGQSNC